MGRCWCPSAHQARRLGVVRLCAPYTFSPSILVSASWIASNSTGSSFACVTPARGAASRALHRASLQRETRLLIGSSIQSLPRVAPIADLKPATPLAHDNYAAVELAEFRSVERRDLHAGRVWAPSGRRWPSRDNRKEFNQRTIGATVCARPCGKL